jgi:YqaJ-like viral recombinase domain
MALSATQLKARDGKLTASCVGVLMDGDPAKVLALWEEMLGMREPEDLSAVWAVQLGTITEELNLSWYEFRTGRELSNHGTVVVHPEASWAACTLDAFDRSANAPVEAKHVGGFEPREKVIERYQPQLHWQMLCTATTTAMLSIIEGAREPAIVLMEYNEAYAAELWARATAFMKCVEDLTPPVVMPPVAAPVAPGKFRVVTMEGNNAWATFAVDWLANRDASKTFDKAEKELKALVEPDVGLASGHGIQAKRNKAGALSISATKG